MTLPSALTHAYLIPCMDYTSLAQFACTNKATHQMCLIELARRKRLVGWRRRNNTEPDGACKITCAEIVGACVLFLGLCFLWMHQRMRQNLEPILYSATYHVASETLELQGSNFCDGIDITLLGRTSRSCWVESANQPHRSCTRSVDCRDVKRRGQDSLTCTVPTALVSGLMWIHLKCGGFYYFHADWNATFPEARAWTAIRPHQERTAVTGTHFLPANLTSCHYHELEARWNEWRVIRVPLDMKDDAHGVCNLPMDVRYVAASNADDIRPLEFVRVQNRPID